MDKNLYDISSGNKAKKYINCGIYKRGFQQNWHFFFVFFCFFKQGAYTMLLISRSASYVTTQPLQHLSANVCVCVPASTEYKLALLTTQSGWMLSNWSMPFKKRCRSIKMNHPMVTYQDFEWLITCDILFSFFFLFLLRMQYK